MSVIKEFSKFIARGNVVDLAVGIIVGAAFTSIVNSFVKDVVNPVIGLAGHANFDNLFLVLRAGKHPGPYETPALAQTDGAVTLNYGSFLTNVINFLIVAFVMFMVVKAINSFWRKEEQAPNPPEPNREEQLLTEIRDILAGKAPAKPEQAS